MCHKKQQCRCDIQITAICCNKTSINIIALCRKDIDYLPLNVIAMTVMDVHYNGTTDYISDVLPLNLNKLTLNMGATVATSHNNWPCKLRQLIIVYRRLYLYNYQYRSCGSNAKCSYNYLRNIPYYIELFEYRNHLASHAICCIKTRYSVNNVITMLNQMHGLNYINMKMFIMRKYKPSSQYDLLIIQNSALLRYLPLSLQKLMILTDIAHDNVLEYLPPAITQQCIIYIEDCDVWRPARYRKHGRCDVSSDIRIIDNLSIALLKCIIYACTHYTPRKSLQLHRNITTNCYHRRILHNDNVIEDEHIKNWIIGNNIHYSAIKY
jgi:hypothetical protein